MRSWRLGGKVSLPECPLPQIQDEVSLTELVLCSQPGVNPSSRMLSEESVVLRGGA